MDYQNFIQRQAKNPENSQKLAEIVKRGTKKFVNNTPVSDLRSVASAYCVGNVYALNLYQDGNERVGNYDSIRNVIYLHYEISVETAKSYPLLDADKLAGYGVFGPEDIEKARRLENNRECLIRTCDDAVYYTLFHEIGHKKTSPPPPERASDFEEKYNAIARRFRGRHAFDFFVSHAYAAHLELKAEEWGISALEKSKKV